MAFGDVAVDDTATNAPFPAHSMVAGLLANALGYRRRDADATQRLQDGMSIATRIDRRGERLSDFQTAQLSKKSVMWTTRGRVLGRDGGDETYGSPNVLQKDFWADAAATVVVTFQDQGMADAAAAALRRPARPLFLGRKACPPSCPILVGVIDTDNLLEALLEADWAADADRTVDLQWPADWGRREPCREAVAIDLKDWINGVHVRTRQVLIGQLQREIRP